MKKSGVISGGPPHFGRGEFRQAGRMPGEHGEGKSAVGANTKGTGMRKEKLSKSKGVSRSVRP